MINAFVNEKGEFDRQGMTRWLQAFEEAPWVRTREPGIQRKVDELAIECRQAGEPALGIGLAMLGACRAMNLEWEAMARLLEIFNLKGARSVEQACRLCKCTNFNCPQCIEKTGRACRWVEIDLCSACAGQEGLSEL